MKRDIIPKGFSIFLILQSVVCLVSCGEDTGSTEVQPPDFYVTVKFEQDYTVKSVDELVVIFENPSIQLSETPEGEYADGTISWRIGPGTGTPNGAFRVTLSKEYVQTNAVLVGPELYELDIPINGGANEGSFTVIVSAKWTNLEGDSREIGRGTATLELPPTDRTQAIVEVKCREPHLQYTCRTGCQPSQPECTDGSNDCGSGFLSCEEGCCIPE